MPVREILQLGDPRLWLPSELVTDPTSEKVREGCGDLAATLSDFRLRCGFGRAIAAPQIGWLQRVIFLNTGEPTALINPRILSASEERMELWDDCFSFPDLMVRVTRHAQVLVRYSDVTGRETEIAASGDLSELLQHEIDHLDGILAVDRAIGPHPLALRREIQRLQTPPASQNNNYAGGW
ncbi:MAG: peptide deformylase [Acidobacteriota bacterium]